MSLPLLTLEINLEPDVILARQRARQVAALLGFPLLDQTRVATATSEITRNAFERAGGGRVEFSVEPGPFAALRIRVEERGPATRLRRAVAIGDAVLNTATGAGTLGARRLMDRFEIAPASTGGDVVSMAKNLPKGAAGFTPGDLGRIAGELTRQAPRGLLEELQEQNQELLRTLQELRERQSEIAQLHANELEETNRGVVALYAELDENAKSLKRISDLKSRFLSNMSHEFRSPLNTILSLTVFLLERSDGELTPEQEKQVHFIRKAAESLSTLVNDLLDLAKVEAGKAVVRAESFEVSDLFESLGGSIRPLLEQRPVALRIEPAAIPALWTDEGKLSQILRNFLSNAVKFTERGEIRVAASTGPGDTVIFSVSDTGLGIAASDLRRIFEEFGQVEGPHQAKVKGTGLGLPLSRKLAELLGGAVSVRSELGVGSTFVAVVPRSYREVDAGDATPETRWRLDPSRRPVVVIDDDGVDMLLYEKMLEGTQFQILPARTLEEAHRVLGRIRPMAVLLDLLPEEEGDWPLLAELKSREATKGIPVFVLTGQDAEERTRSLGAAGFQLKPVDPSWLMKTLGALTPDRPRGTLLVIDDEESHRYVLKDLLSAHGEYVIIEAIRGEEGIRRARDDRPNAIFLDLAMPDMTGFEVLDRLKADPTTREIPIVIYTSMILDPEERAQLAAQSAAVLAKAAGPRDAMLEAIRDALGRVGLEPAPAGAEA